MLKPIVLYILIAIIPIIFTTGCTSEATEIEAALPREVTVKTLTMTSPTSEVAATGSLSFKDTVTLSFETGGVITSLSFSGNQYVSKGQSLASLDTRDLQLQFNLAEAQLEQARLQLKKAEKGARDEELSIFQSQYQEALLAHEDLEKQYEDFKSLYEAGAIPKRQLKDIELQLETVNQRVLQAEAQLELIKSGATDEEVALLKSQVSQGEHQLELASHQLSKATISAPFNGIVLKKHASKGELAAPGHPIVTLGSRDAFLFTFGVTSSQLFHFNTGQELDISLDAGTSLLGVVTSIDYAPDPATRLYQVEAEVSPDQAEQVLRAGMIGHIYLSAAKEEQVLLVPAEAVVSQSNQQVVFVLGDNGRAHKKPVTIGHIVNGMLQIKEGLAEGEQIIVEGAPFLRNNEEVRVKGSDQ